MVTPLKYVTHVQRDAVTFPAAERYRLLIGSELYSLVKVAQGCEKLVDPAE